MPTQPKKPSTAPDPGRQAKYLTLRLLLGSALLSALADHFDWTTRAFLPAKENAANFALFAGFFVAAQVIERLLELVAPFVPWWEEGDSKEAKIAQARADRALLLLGVATLAGVGLSAGLGLYFLSAVGMHIPVWLDILITGITIGGGTKPLHDLISNIEKASAAKVGGI